MSPVKALNGSNSYMVATLLTCYLIQTLVGAYSGWLSLKRNLTLIFLTEIVVELAELPEIPELLDMTDYAEPLLQFKIRVGIVT